MARSRSFLAPALLAAALVAGALLCHLPVGFVPPATSAARLGDRLFSERVLDGAQVAIVAALATSPLPAVALASSDDDEGFDFRFIAVLGLPVVAASWALFNVWRVAFRQGVRLNEGLSGSSKLGLNAED
mmetsp:Transcript_162538/g.516354  ORF Transcript_162538/g.516354 Transcript_162538/m.516354 type:complete len:130 (-) Transcript_162538:129-518(-)